MEEWPWEGSNFEMIECGTSHSLETYVIYAYVKARDSHETWENNIACLVTNRAWEYHPAFGYVFSNQLEFMTIS